MTKDELFDRWIDDFGYDYIFTGVPHEDKEQFFQDLEDWYETRHVAELNAIKKELIKTLSEMDAAVSQFKGEGVQHSCNDNCHAKGGYDCYD